MFRHIKTRVLVMLLCLSLGASLILSGICLSGIYKMRKDELLKGKDLGERTADISRNTLQQKATQEMLKTADDRAALTNEKLAAIAGHTRMIADVAGKIYTHKENYKPRAIDYLKESQIGTTIPHIRTAPHVLLVDIQEEVDLAANVVDVLSQIEKGNWGIAANYIGTESGFFITVDTRAKDPQRTDYDVTKRNWYQNAKTKEALCWSDVFSDSAGRGASISCSMPFYDRSGKTPLLKGVAGSGALLTDVSHIINSTVVGKTGYGFLLNEKGQIVVSPMAQDVMIDEQGNMKGTDFLNSTQEDLRILAERMIGKGRGIMKVSMKGQPVYVAYSPLSVVDWSMGIVLPVEEVLAPSEEIQRVILNESDLALMHMDKNIGLIVSILLGSIFLITLMTIFLAFRFAGQITKPILTLTKGVGMISDGNLDTRLSVKTQDETRALADAFNEMTKRLKAYIQDLSVVTAEKERITTELNVATRIQTSMLPCIFPAYPDRKEFELYAKMLTAKEVGGDFYDFFLIDENHLGLVIADVSGKGVPAALFMVIAKTLIKNQAQTGILPHEVFSAVNKQLCENNDANMFVTAFFMKIDLQTGFARYVNAGHNFPVLGHAGSAFCFIPKKPDFVLGGLEEAKYHTHEMILRREDMLFLFTDGVNEAMDIQNELFGNERLMTVLNQKSQHLGPQAYIDAMNRAISDFADGAEQADDITMLSLRYVGSGESQSIRLPARIEALDEVLSFLNRCLRQFEIDEKYHINLQVVVEEIFVNIAHYAYLEEKGDVDLCCEKNEDTLRLIFYDRGTAYNPLEKPEPDVHLSAEERPIGGLGIYIVKQFMDRCFYYYQGEENILVLEKEV